MNTTRKSPTCTFSDEQVHSFHHTGYIRIPDLLANGEVERYLELYLRFINGTIDTAHLRADLAGEDASAKNVSSPEKITQIMWPSSIVPTLLDGALHSRTLSIAKQLFGQDMAFDFDMLINKAPNTNAPTPWHQDTAYWIDLPDRRAISFWVALDEATIDNGCMWFSPGSHLEPMRPHRQTGGNGALECDADEQEGIAVPLGPGDATIHHGATLHYSRGNSTSQHRPAYILNFRPEQMIRLEREQGMDHGLAASTREIRNRAPAEGSLG